MQVTYDAYTVLDLPLYVIALPSHTANIAISLTIDELLTIGIHILQKRIKFFVSS